MSDQSANTMLPSWVDPQPKPVEHVEIPAIASNQDLKADAEFVKATSQAAGCPVGSFSFEGTTPFVWLYDMVKVPSRGRRRGQLDRSAPLVREAVDVERLCTNDEYRTRLFKRMGYSPYEGMAIGDSNIQYSGAGATLDFRAFTKPRNVGASPDSFDKATEGNFSESFEGGKNVSNWQEAKTSYFKSPRHGAPAAVEFSPVTVKVPRKARHSKQRQVFLDAQAAKRRHEAQRADAEAAKIRQPKPCARPGCDREHTRFRYCSASCSNIVRQLRKREKWRDTLLTVNAVGS